MKRILLPSAGELFARTVQTTIVLMAIALESSLAAPIESLRSISVSGTVATKVAPDQILWQINLTSSDPSLLKAKSLSDEQVKAVVRLRDELGIEEGDLQTGQVTVHREYERDQMGNRGKFKHFTVYRGITIRQRDLKAFDQYLDKLVASTDMDVTFNFESSRMHQFRSDTRLKALDVARQKAAAMVKALGGNLGQVLTINEHPLQESSRNPVSNFAVVESTPTADVTTETFIPGSITIPVTVFVTFEIE
jgi:uncharacterized protein YggE